MNLTKPYDAIILGGSYSGLSAAMALGRSLRKTLIIDSGKPCNRQTPHSHNFLTQDGQTPQHISALARKQVEHYPSVEFHNGLATSATQTTGSFEVAVESGETFAGKKLIIATGIKDLLPDIPGFAACWGISIIHCPYCHGYEVRHQKTAIFANGERAFHLATLVQNLTEQLTILTSGAADFTSEQGQYLERAGIPIIEDKVVEIEHENGQLQQVLFEDGSEGDFVAMYAAVPFEQQTDIPQVLGCALTEAGFIQVDSMQKTTVDGVLACGDNASFMRSVANAVASGNAAGAVVNGALATTEISYL